MKHTTSRVLFAYWDALRGDRAAPDRAEVQPSAIRHILADTFILELDARQNAFIRLAGTRCCALFGAELRGRPLASLWNASSAPEVEQHVDIVVEETAGMVLGLRGETRDGRCLGPEMVLLPMRHKGKTHTRILGALSPVITPPWLGIHAIEGLETTSSRTIQAPSALRHPPRVVGATPSERRQRFVVHPGGRP